MKTVWCGCGRHVGMLSTGRATGSAVSTSLRESCLGGGFSSLRWLLAFGGTTCSVHRILIFERMGTGYFFGCGIKSCKSTLQPRSGDRHDSVPGPKNQGSGFAGVRWVCWIRGQLSGTGIGDRHRSVPVPYPPMHSDLPVPRSCLCYLFIQQVRS